VVGGLCLSDPESYAGRRFCFQVGPPKPDRLKGRGLTKSDPLLALQVWGWKTGLTTQSHRKVFVMEAVSYGAQAIIKVL